MSSIVYAESTVRVTPNYYATDITRLAGTSEELTDEDYRLLFEQTGLGRAAVDSLADKSELLIFQKNFFAQAEHKCENIALASFEERMTNMRAKLAPLEDGDVLITYNCHFLSWRNGHAAIVTNAEKGETLEAVVVGEKTGIQSVLKWSEYPNFIILRLKDASLEERKAIAQSALENLNDLTYSLTVGFYPKKRSEISKARSTQCAHLVWLAYAEQGYEIDSRGGAIVTPDDIARSDLFETVQIFGRVANGN